MDKNLKIWIDLLVNKFTPVFKGKNLPHIYADFANGSGTAVAMDVFGRLGFKVTAFNTETDGKNINVDCGATHPEFLKSKMTAGPGGHPLVGISFDGDADRCIVIDETGKVVTGDVLMAALCLTSNAKTLISTIMFNSGTQKFLEQKGVELVRTKVGDRFIVEAIKQLDNISNIIAGEPSGHYVFPEIFLSGDGLLSALMILKMIVETGKPLNQLCGDIPMWPSILKNVTHEVESGEYWKGDARVLIRKSGTERLWRILVEAPTQKQCQEILDDILKK